MGVEGEWADKQEEEEKLCLALQGLREEGTGGGEGRERGGHEGAGEREGGREGQRERRGGEERRLVESRGGRGGEGKKVAGGGD